jgi:hypothetical protein
MTWRRSGERPLFFTNGRPSANEIGNMPNPSPPDMAAQLIGEVQRFAAEANERQLSEFAQRLFATGSACRAEGRPMDPRAVSAILRASRAELDGGRTGAAAMHGAVIFNGRYRNGSE